MVLLRRSFVFAIALALSISCVNAFTSCSKSFVTKTSLSALPDSLDIPEFHSNSVASPSVESLVDKVASVVPSAAVPSVSIGDRIPAIPDVSIPATVVPPEVTSLPASSGSAVAAGGFPTELLPIGLGVLAIAAIGAVVMSGNKGDAGSASAAAPASSTANSPTATATGNDVSIPYDAAARLAYGSGNEAGFAEFKKKYEEETVKMVMEKKKARGTGY